MDVPRFQLAAVLLVLAAMPAAAQPSKPMRFWNLTRDTITHLQLSPAGKEQWGEDQCRNDRDGAVDHDERLPLTGVAPGKYDIKLADRSGRMCVVRDLDLAAGAVVTVEEAQLTDCSPAR